MSKLWTPPDVAEEWREHTAIHNRVLLEAMDFDTPGMSAIRRELESFDPLLRLGRAKDRAHLPGVEPGFWHIIRLNEVGPYYCAPLTGEMGGYAEPSLAMFDALRKADLQSPQVVRARQAEDERAVREKEREDARENEELVDDIMERWKAVSETSVSMNSSSGWSQNVAGRRGRKH